MPLLLGGPQGAERKTPPKMPQKQEPKEVGQQLPLTPPLVGNCPAKGLRHLVSRSRFSSDSLGDLTQVT